MVEARLAMSVETCCAMLTRAEDVAMTSLTIALPEDMKAFV
jgi:hypothetical protein